MGDLQSTERFISATWIKVTTHHLPSKSSSPDPSAALNLAGEAVNLEQKAAPPPAGPPIDPILPSAETLAILLYAEGQYSVANQYYEKVLSVHPNRTQSLLGLARTYAALGGSEKKEYIELAIQTYKKVLRQLARADFDGRW